MSCVKIRPAKADDAAAIAEVHVETWRSSYAGLVPENYLAGMTVAGQSFMWRKIIAQSRRQMVRVAIAEDRGLVGFASGGSVRRGALAFDAEIYTLYVLPDWQNQGIGRRLLEALFLAFRERGLRSAYLWVLSRNPSRFFYEAVGGRRAGEKVEVFAGAALEQAAYVWPDLSAWLMDPGRARSRQDGDPDERS